MQNCTVLLYIKKSVDFLILDEFRGRKQIRTVVNFLSKDLGCFPFTSPRRQRLRQTLQRLFTLPKSQTGDLLSIYGNSSNAGDTGFAGKMETPLASNTNLNQSMKGLNSFE